LFSARVTLGAFLCLIALLTAAPAALAAPSRGSYIVVLKDGVAHPANVAHRHEENRGAEVGHIFGVAIKAYSADLTPDELRAIRQDPNVDYVERDGVLQLDSQEQSTGFKRVFAPSNPNLHVDEIDDVRTNVDIAIFDNGVAPHPDLNVVARIDCTAPGQSGCINETIPAQGSHGTPVAGIAAAIDNNFGVVGTAPGARIWSVKVFGGSLYMSDLIAAVNWTTAHSSEIEVVNMSFHCLEDCSPTALRAAIAASVDQGVVYVAAAANEGKNVEAAPLTIPAAFPDVITVSSLADSDGAPGGVGGPPSCASSFLDDYLANTSNWGAAVDIAAPGVCIRTTVPGGGYASPSGTSMAAPMVAGAVAGLAAAKNPNNRQEVEAIRNFVRSLGNYNWTDTHTVDVVNGTVIRQPDGIQEPLLDMGVSTPYVPPTPVLPQAATEDAILGEFGQVTLNGSVDPNGWETRYLFQFGTTTSYGADGPEAGAGGSDGFVVVNSPITGLAEGTTYHYRLVAKNAAGTVYGGDRTFTTPAVQDSGSWATRVPSTNPNAPIFTYARGTTGHLMQTWWDGSNWQSKDLGGSLAAGSSPAVVRPPSTDPNAPIYVFYQGSNGNLKETWWNGSVWSTEDRGVAMAANASPIVVRGPSTNPNAPIYVFYQGSNGNLTETWWNEYVWSTEDRGVAMAAKTNPSVARVPSTNPNAPIYVFYRGSNGNLKETWWNEYVWSTEDRGAAIAPETSPSVTRIVSTNPNVPIAVFYRTPTGKLAETWWNEYVWSTNPTVGSAEIAAGSSPAAIRTPSTNPNAPIHVFYRGAAGKLTDTWWNESVWSSEVKGGDVALGATPVVLRPPSTNPNASIFTFYKGASGFLNETWFNESVWSTKAFTTGMG
jgi:hypothetical protein